jgi:membrane-bound lytic murein transglycosylase F
VVVPRPDSALILLNAGQGDVIAARLYPTEDWQRRVIYTKPWHSTPMVIVQRDAPPAAVHTDRAVERTLSPDSAPRGTQPDLPKNEQVHREGQIKTPAELGGREVHVRDQTIMEERLQEIDDSLTSDIRIITVNAKVSTESLVRKVGQGSVDLTASPENVALLTMAYYDNLSTRPSILPDAKLVWAVRRNAPGMVTALNAWIDQQRDGALHKKLYRKYFEDQRGYKARVVSRYLTSETGELSPFDALLKRLASVVGWDWRLLASQAY